jgi:hypothetical protein
MDRTKKWWILLENAENEQWVKLMHNLTVIANASGVNVQAALESIYQPHVPHKVLRIPAKVFPYLPSAFLVASFIEFIKPLEAFLNMSTHDFYNPTCIRKIIYNEQLHEYEACIQHSDILRQKLEDAVKDTGTRLDIFKLIKQMNVLKDTTAKTRAKEKEMLLNTAKLFQLDPNAFDSASQICVVALLDGTGFTKQGRFNGSQIKQIADTLLAYCEYGNEQVLNFSKNIWLLLKKIGILPTALCLSY